MEEKFSLKDHLFNAESVGQLAAEYAQAVPKFDADRFTQEALSGFPERELLERLDWLADCVEAQLATDFPTMAAQLRDALPPKLDPSKTDDDFGRFIHGVPGILAVRHGLEDHRDLALDLLHEATQRFSMEFYIRPFLNTWPAETLARLNQWAVDENYHVRRLVSEGTRPKLPWAKSVSLTPDQTLPLLDKLHADPTRYVTRSVANHMNDLSKIVPDQTLATLSIWTSAGKQVAKELDWMQRHSLRTLIKQGHPGAMAALGFGEIAGLTAKVGVDRPTVRIGEAVTIEAELTAPSPAPILVDYVLELPKSDGSLAPKVFKLKTANLVANTPLALRKVHKLKKGATTFTLYPGPARVSLQVNGTIVGSAAFTLVT